GYSRVKSAMEERMVADAALHKSVGLLDEAQRLAQLGSWELDIEKNELAWSDEIYRIFGLEPQEFGATYEAFLETVHPDDRALVKDAYDESVRSGGVYDIVHRIVRRSTGEVRYVREMCEHFKNDAGRIVRSVGTVHDVTERHRTEELEHLLSSIVQSSDDGIIGKGTDGAILSWNRGAEKIYGYSAAEAVGQSISMLVPPERAEELREIMVKLEGGERVEHFETERVRKDGRHIFVSLTVSPIRDAAGHIMGASTISRDITERRNLEKQLCHAQKMEAVGTLTGGIAHDFNNILTAIIGFGTLLEMNLPGDAPSAQYVTEILTAAERAAGLTRSLLAFSRKETIEARPVCLNGIITGIEKMLRRLIREDITLKLALMDGTLTILADAGQIEQVLLNLLANARDAMPEGGTMVLATDRLELDEAFTRTHGFGEPGSYAHLAFSDTGVGMEESVLRRIFEPFYTTKEVGKGTGLGLSIVYGIVRQHKGYINCYSEPGHGTTFNIYIPLISTGAGHEQRPATAVPGGTETILLAEDDPAVRNLVTRILKEFGYAVIAAQDGEEALARFKERADEIDVCLFDVIMPGKRGIEAFEEIRKIRPAVRGIFMSGYQADHPAQADAIQEGRVFISKPIIPRELLRKVREVLDA
ncbi:MAG TPA: PAS domain S-box protein, partial [Geobacteraceae bacterium]